MPGGGAVYQLLQNRFGEFRRGDFVERRFLRQVSLAGAVVDHGGTLDGARIVEVGTGWVPLVPLGFWICGAAGVSTFDLSRYLSPGLTRRCLRWMSGHAERLGRLFGDLAPEDEVRRKLAIVDRLKDRPLELLERAGIVCRAPADASDTGLPKDSVDLHYSANVLEHVRRETLGGLLREGRRILRTGGLSVHHVDPSDHFAHTDPSIPRIHFLRFEEGDWRRYYDNRFAYLNRLHDPDYRQLFAEAGLRLLDADYDLDRPSLSALEDGFPLASPFRDKSFEELCRFNITYVAVPESEGA